MNFEKYRQTHNGLEMERKDMESKGSLIEREREVAYISDRTSDLETRIEGQRSFEQSWLRNVSRQLTELMRSKGSRAAEIAVILGSLGFLSPVESQAEFNQSSTNVILCERVKEQTGFDLGSIAEKNGMVAEVQIPSDTGEYFVHIGQKHYIEKADEDENIAKEIAESQKKIEKVLLNLADQGERSFFIEGYTSELARQYGTDYLDEIRAFVREIEVEKESFKKLAHKYLASIENLNEEDSLERGMIAKRRAIFTKRAKELKDELQTKNIFDGDVPGEYEKCLKSLSSRVNFAGLGDDVVYVYGAATKLQAEGIASLIPAETKAGNEGAFRYEAQRKEAAEAYFKAPISIDTLDEVKKLKESYEHIKALDDKATMDDREDIAVSLMAEHHDTSNKIKVVIYGAAHSFGDNLKKFQAKGQYRGVGLVKITAKKGDDK